MGKTSIIIKKKNRLIFVIGFLLYSICLQAQEQNQNPNIETLVGYIVYTDPAVSPIFWLADPEIDITEALMENTVGYDLSLREIDDDELLLLCLINNTLPFSKSQRGICCKVSIEIEGDDLSRFYSTKEYYVIHLYPGPKRDTEDNLIYLPFYSGTRLLSTDFQNVTFLD